MEMLSIAFSLFLLMDPIGNIPFYISFLKGVDNKRQRYIIFRELIIALFIIYLFAFLGNGLMDFLKVDNNTIQIVGGIVLFLMCLKMIFPTDQKNNQGMPHEPEPFIVPLAVPLVAGPAVLAAAIIYSKQASSIFVMGGAILIAWFVSLLILICSSYFNRLLGWKGIVAMERLMGLILILIAVQMFLSGLGSFIKENA